MSTVEQLSSNIKTFRTVMGATLVTSFQAVFLFVWIQSGRPGDVMTGTFVLTVVVSLIGLFGEGAVSSARSIIGD